MDACFSFFLMQSVHSLLHDMGSKKCGVSEFLEGPVPVDRSTPDPAGQWV